MTGDVRVMVTCILGSEQEVRMMAASSTEPFTSYFSGVTTCRTATNVLRIQRSSTDDNSYNPPATTLTELGLDNTSGLPPV